MPTPGANSDPPANGYPSYPHNLVTGFLVPSYGTKPKVHQRVLLAVAEDGTRTGRIKSGIQYGFDLVYKNRSTSEYATLMSFWQTMGLHLPFNYYDKLQNVWFTLYFDSEIEGEYLSFALIDFSVAVISGT